MIQCVEDELYYRPRKILRFKTLAEIHFEILFTWLDSLRLQKTRHVARQLIRLCSIRTSRRASSSATAKLAKTEAKFQVTNIHSSIFSESKSGKTQLWWQSKNGFANIDRYAWLCPLMHGDIWPIGANGSNFRNYIPPYACRLLWFIGNSSKLSEKMFYAESEIWNTCKRNFLHKIC